MLTILFDGVASGMILFVIALGLVVTLGLMNFINLAHGAFSMLAGYLAVVLTQRLGAGFLLALTAAFLAAAALGALLERMLFRRLYDRSPLEQVLVSIGLVFMASAAADYFFGASPLTLSTPAWLSGRSEWGEGAWMLGVGHYRLFVIAVCLLLTLVLHRVIWKTRAGSRLRAAVDDRPVAAALGIDVDRVFSASFALGCGLAGLGGALGAPVLGLDPTFALKYMFYFLAVCAVGGTVSMIGPLGAALLLGVADVAGKYYLPQLGGFIIDAVILAALMLRPDGLIARRGARA
jgi:branched-chain amino acid transport system permease protein